MNKYMLLLVLLLGLSACTVKDAEYYRYHPKELEKVMAACPDKEPAHVSCQQIQDIAIHLNSLARKLQYNPQGFGETILKLQETVAKQQAALIKQSADKDLESDLKKNKNDLAEHLVIVRWLESPES